jgi:hypothetical protein
VSVEYTPTMKVRERTALVYAEDVLHGLARPVVTLYDDPRFNNGETQDAKHKEAGRND